MSYLLFVGVEVKVRCIAVAGSCGTGDIFGDRTLVYHFSVEWNGGHDSWCNSFRYGMIGNIH